MGWTDKIAALQEGSSPPYGGRGQGEGDVALVTWIQPGPSYCRASLSLIETAPLTLFPLPPLGGEETLTKGFCKEHAIADMCHAQGTG
mgnify:CR=1 FL=1|jgi:hypothetical protein